MTIRWGWLGVLVGCASADAVKEDWDAYVAERSSWEVAEDCVVRRRSW